MKKNGMVESEENRADGTNIKTTTTRDNKTTRTTSKTDSDGNKIKVVENSDGTFNYEKNDKNGKIITKVDSNRNGSKIITDAKGRTTEISAREDDGSYEIVKTDSRGNKTTLKVDKKGQILSQREKREVPNELHSTEP